MRIIERDYLNGIPQIRVEHFTDGNLQMNVENDRMIGTKGVNL